MVNLLPTLRSARLSTRLALTLTAILMMAAAVQTLLYFRTREDTLREADSSYQDLAKAIEVAATQMGESGWKDERVLEDYRQKLARSGLKDIQITEAGKPFPAGPSPTPVASRTKRGRGAVAPKDVKITGSVGEGGTVHELRLPLVVDGKLQGWIEIKYSLENIRGELENHFRRRLFALVGTWAFGLILVLLVARGVASPLEQMSRAAARVADGDLDVSVAAERNDEIGQLATSFNRMTERLRERQELEARLSAAEKRAEIGHLASGLAHEIKNPLNALSLGLDVLRRRHRPEAEAAAEDYARRIRNLREEIDRLAALINNFLAYGRPLSLNRATVDLAGIVQATVSDLGETAAQVGVTLKAELDHGLPCASADGSLVKSALWNLVQNAVQEMESRGGTLRVVLRRSPADGPPRAEFLVEDDGPGISPTDLPNLFEPYFSRKEGGVGLGLAMVKRIVEEHGGSVSAENREEGGARFRLLLPLPAG